MYRTIMVPLDGSSLGEYALPLALGLARRADVTVNFVHVCTPPEPVIFRDQRTQPLQGEALREQMRQRAHEYLDPLAAALTARWEVAITATVLEGRAADTLCDQALATGAELVVMTTHGYGRLAQAWMGSVADKLVRRLPMPILLARPHEPTLDLLESVHERVFEHVLIPLDGSTLAEEIFEPALSLGVLMDAKCTLIQAIEIPMLGYAPALQAVGLDEQVLAQWRAETESYLERAAARMCTRGLMTGTNVAYGPPAMAIIDYAHNHAVDLIALSTHGRGGLSRMILGSVADKLVRGADIPVLLQRPRGAIATGIPFAYAPAEQVERNAS